MELLVFFQVITMIVTLSHSKECFCCFVAKLRCCQVFLQRKRSSPVWPYHANCSCFSLKWKLSLVFVQNWIILTLFRTGNGFKLFEANHVVLTLIWSTKTFLLFAGNLHSFQLYCSENPQKNVFVVTLLSGFFPPKRSSPVCGLITLILALPHSNGSYSCLVKNSNVLTFFALQTI